MRSARPPELPLRRKVAALSNDEETPGLRRHVDNMLARRDELLRQQRAQTPSTFHRAHSRRVGRRERQQPIALQTIRPDPNSHNNSSR
jgi:hypothetical protein